MHEHVFGPEEVIVKAENFEEPRIYIIIKGEVELYWQVGTDKTTAAQMAEKDNEKHLKVNIREIEEG